MRIFNNKYFLAILIGLAVVGIVFVLSVYASHAVERSFYTRAVNPLETIYVAEEQYKQSFPQHGYSRTLGELGGPGGNDCAGPDPPTPLAACLIDQVLANATSPASAKSGYFYTYIAGQSNAQGIVESYSVHSDPATPQSDRNHFYTDETGIIRVEQDKPAGKGSPIKKTD
jgi:type IV pilus assembly protein PilA